MNTDNMKESPYLFRLSPYNKTAIFEDIGDIYNRSDTPILYLKSTVRQRNNMNKSIFNFSFADINQLLPEIKFQNVEDKPEVIEDRDTIEEPSDCTSTKLTKEDSVKLKVIKRPNILEDVCKSLSHVFNGIKIEETDVDLVNHEKRLFKYVIRKKFIRESEDTLYSDIISAEDSELIEIVNNLYDKYESTKRKEEKIKFVFKHTMKSLKKRYFKNNDLQNSADNEVKFFSNYFEQTHKDKNLSIEVFFDPLNNSNTLNPKFKTLSKDYITLLFDNLSFKEDFLNYIEGKFIKDYQQNVCKKFKKLFKRLRKKMRHGGYSNYDLIVDEFIYKFAANKRCKLPWTNKEIVDAVFRFKSHLETLY